MRIIGGTCKGRILRPRMKGWPTRPTTDIAKEALFNVLMNRLNFEEVAFLDLFGGTGAHTFEFLSRGCMDVTYVDNYLGCVQFVRKTSSELGFNKFLSVVRMDVFKYIKICNRKFDYIFAGPPYPLHWLDKIPDLVFSHELLDANGFFVLEHNDDHNFSGHTRLQEKRKYGQTNFSFFS